MKSVEKKTALVISLALLVMIFIFLGTLIRAGCASAQGSGQGYQGQGLYGLGGGAMLGIPGMNMIMPGFSMAGLVPSVMANPLGLGAPMSGSGSVSMLGTVPGIMGGGPMLGLGTSNPFSMLPLPFYSGGGFGPYTGPLMPIMGLGFVYTGMPPVTPFSTFLDGGLPMGYSGYFATSYGNEILKRFSNSTGITGVPYFYYAGGIVTSPLPPWVQQMQLLQPSIMFPSEVKGYVLNEEGEPLEGVEVTLLNSSPQKSYTTKSDGLYLFSLFTGTYTLGFGISGYEGQEKIVSVMGGLEEWVDNVYMKKEPQPPPQHNKEPVFILNMLTMEVMVGETIVLDPYALVYDEDGDSLTFSYSGWKADFWRANASYTTNENDINDEINDVHEVKITASDQKSLVTNTLKIIVYPGYKLTLYEGYNLISYPFENGDTDFTASDLLEKLGGANQIDSIAYYDNNTDQYIWYDPDEETHSLDFPIKIGQGYIIYALEDIEKTVINRYIKKEQSLNLYEGMNLIGVTSYPEGYTSYNSDDLLYDLGYNCVESIYRYNPLWGDWEGTYWLNGSHAGDIFPIFMGEGYHIQMKTQCSLSLPRLRFFIF